MDRIRKALDLARLEREAREERGEPKVRYRGFVDGADPLKSTESRVIPSAPPVIEYSTTQTFVPRPALLESNRILDPSRSTAATAAFKILRTQVLQRMSEHQWRSLAVVSPNGEEGKTTTAVNLAISLASDQWHTVLLVEFDLRRPKIAKMLGIDPEMGADDLLRGNARIEECLYHPEGFDRLVVLPVRAAMPNSSETLAGPGCRALVAELRERYPDRLLVFDLPPILGSDDTLAFLPQVECALVVVAEGVTPRDDLLRSMELLRNSPVVGTVLNRATEVVSPYGT
jgi:Mrp family chromosome partitioning ATPase